MERKKKEKKDSPKKFSFEDRFRKWYFSGKSFKENISKDTSDIEKDKKPKRKLEKQKSDDACDQKKSPRRSFPFLEVKTFMTHENSRFTQKDQKASDKKEDKKKKKKKEKETALVKQEVPEVICLKKSSQPVDLQELKYFKRDRALKEKKKRTERSKKRHKKNKYEMVKVVHPSFEDFEKRHESGGNTIVIYHRENRKYLHGHGREGYPFEHVSFMESCETTVEPVQSNRSFSEPRHNDYYVARRRARFPVEPFKMVSPDFRTAIDFFKQTNGSFEYNKFEDITNSPQVNSTPERSKSRGYKQSEPKSTTDLTELALENTAEKKLNLHRELIRSENSGKKKFWDSIDESLNYRCALAEMFSTQSFLTKESSYLHHSNVLPKANIYVRESVISSYHVSSGDLTSTTIHPFQGFGRFQSPLQITQPLTTYRTLLIEGNNDNNSDMLTQKFGSKTTHETVSAYHIWDQPESLPMKGGSFDRDSQLESLMTKLSEEITKCSLYLRKLENEKTNDLPIRENTAPLNWRRPKNSVFVYSTAQMEVNSQDKIMYPRDTDNDLSKPGTSKEIYSSENDSKSPYKTDSLSTDLTKYSEKSSNNLKYTGTDSISTQSYVKENHHSVTSSSAKEDRIRREISEESRMRRAVSIPDEPRMRRDGSVTDEPRMRRDGSITDEPRMRRAVSIPDEPRMRRDGSITDESRMRRAVSIPDEPRMRRDGSITEQPRIRKEVSITEQARVRRDLSITEQPRVRKEHCVTEQPRVRKEHCVTEQPRERKEVCISDKSKTSKVYLDEFDCCKECNRLKSKILKLQKELEKLERKMPLYPKEYQDSVRECLESLHMTSDTFLKRMKSCAKLRQRDSCKKKQQRTHSKRTLSAPAPVIHEYRKKAIALGQTNSDYRMNVGLEIKMENVDPITGKKLHPPPKEGFQQEGNVKCRLFQDGKKPLLVLDTDFLYSPEKGMVFGKKDESLSTDLVIPLSTVNKTDPFGQYQSYQPEIRQTYLNLCPEQVISEDLFEVYSINESKPSLTKDCNKKTKEDKPQIPEKSPKAVSFGSRKAEKQSSLIPILRRPLPPTFPKSWASRNSSTSTVTIFPADSRSGHLANILKSLDKRFSQPIQEMMDKSCQTYPRSTYGGVTCKNVGIQNQCSARNCGLQAEIQKRNEKVQTELTLEHTLKKGKKQEEVLAMTVGVQVNTLGKKSIEKISLTSAAVQVNSSVKKICQKNSIGLQTNLQTEENLKYLNDLQVQKKVNLAIAELCFHLTQENEDV